MNLPPAKSASAKYLREGTTSRANVPRHERAKLLKRELSKTFVRIHGLSCFTDAELAEEVNTRRVVVTQWRDPNAPHLPHLGHMSTMPDATLDLVQQALAELRYANGFELRRWVAIACDERAPSADTRLEAVKLMAAELLKQSQELLELAAIIAKGRGR